MGAAAGVIGIGLSIVGGVVNAIGKVREGQAQAAFARYQAQVARNNKIIADQNADWSMRAGRHEATIQGLRTREIAGQTKADIAASGIDVNSGSAVDVVNATRRAGMMDEATILSNASKEAYGWTTQGANFEAQAGLLELEATEAERSGKFNAFSSLLGSATNIASNWNTWRGDAPRREARSVV